MNLDLLTKLVKLANNNPNDNEANAAARKVCKMIEEAQFKFVEDTQPIRPEYSIFDHNQDILNYYRSMYERMSNDKKRR